MRTRLFVALVLVALCAVPVASYAQAPARPSIFDGKTLCEDALKSGNFAYYVPVYLGDRGEEPIDNVRVFGVKLEADQCRYQKTIKGMRWVVQAEGSLMRAIKGPMGEWLIIARDDCGNDDLTPGGPYKAPATPLTDAVAKVTTPIEVIIHVDGEVVVRHTGEVRVADPFTPPVQYRTERHSHKRAWIIVAVIGGGAATTVAIMASHGSHTTAVATVTYR